MKKPRLAAGVFLFQRFTSSWSTALSQSSRRSFVAVMESPRAAPSRSPSRTVRSPLPVSFFASSQSTFRFVKNATTVSSLLRLFR